MHNARARGDHVAKIRGRGWELLARSLDQSCIDRNSRTSFVAPRAPFPPMTMRALRSSRRRNHQISSCYGASDEIGVGFDHLQVGEGGPIGLGAMLFPVPQRAEWNMEAL